VWGGLTTDSADLSRLPVDWRSMLERVLDPLRGDVSADGKVLRGSTRAAAPARTFRLLLPPGEHELTPMAPATPDSARAGAPIGVHLFALDMRAGASNHSASGTPPPAKSSPEPGTSVTIDQHAMLGCMPLHYAPSSGRFCRSFKSFRRPLARLLRLRCFKLIIGTAMPSRLSVTRAA